MTTKNASYNPSAIMFDICQQKKRQQLNNIPPVRFELMKSPYNQYSQRQLDMRRKIEILKYKPILQNSQTNNQTKKERAASILKGTYKQYYEKRDALKCPLDDLLPTPTSSCDVPGPPMILTYDPSVPLYNYISDLQTRSYASLPQDLTIPWSLSYSKNVDFTVSNKTNNSDYISFSSIYFRYLLNQPQITFQLTLPVQISFETDHISVSQMIQSEKYTITINIVEIHLAIYYNESKISDRSIIHTSTQSNLSSQIVIQDISGGIEFNVNRLNIGYIQVPDILFKSETGFIYDLKMSWNVNTTITGSTINPLSPVKITVNSDNQITTYSPFIYPYIQNLITSSYIPPFSLISNDYYIGNPPTIQFMN